MKVQVQVAVPFAVGMPPAVQTELEQVIAAMGLGATEGPEGHGNILTLVAQPVDIDLPDGVVQMLESVLGAALTAQHVLGPPNVIPSPQPPTNAAPPPDTQPAPPPPVGDTNPSGGPWTRSGPYWQDGNYAADLERATQYIIARTGAPNLHDFLIAQSHEETGHGRMFTKINNYWNMGAIDSNPQSAPGFQTPEDGGQAWLDFLGWGNSGSTYANRPSPNESFVALVRAGVSDVRTLATAIQHGGWATDPNYGADVAGAA